jgi:trk system potassium uptake protein TrkH
MLSPLLLLPVYPEEMKHAWAFLLPAGILGGCGVLLRRIFRRNAYVVLSIQEGGIIVLVSWSAVIFFSAWPLSLVLGIDFSRAVFESVSAWTTTGLSVVDVTRAGKLILFWRSAMQLAGGAGLAVIMMSTIMGPTGVGISGAEGRGDQLVPHVRRSARLVLLIYLGYACAGIAAYRLAGMSLFDAVNHSFAAVSTGGFSTRPESIGFWDSPAIEAVSIPLMLLGNLSFVTAWYLWKGEFRAVFRNGEVRLMSALIPFSAAVVFIFTCKSLYPHLEKAFRVAVFESISALTTTGFSTVSYGNWNAFGLFILIVLMLIGGGTCSTAGGIKQFRIHLLWNLLIWEFKRAMMQRQAILDRSVWEGDKRILVDDTRIRQISAFIFLYMAIYGAGVAVMCACGFSLQDSLFEFASAIGTVGLSIGVTSATMPGLALWAETLAMFLGRLEFIVVIVSLLKIGRDGRLLMRPTVKGN